MSLTGPPRMRQVTKWSCPFHDYPQEHYCDCEFCDHPVYLCAGCETAEYVKVFNEDGTPKMYEEQPIDTIMREVYLPPIVEQLNQQVLLLGRLT